VRIVELWAYRLSCGPSRRCQIRAYYIAYLVDQRKLVSWLQTRRSDNVILRTMSVLNRNEFVAVCTRYSRDVDLMTPIIVKDMIWDNFACTVLL